MQENRDKLPHPESNLVQVNRDIDHMCNLGFENLDKTWPPINAEWESRGWDSFLEYFESEWIANLNGWVAGYLGAAGPTTNNGLEGSWKN